MKLYFGNATDQISKNSEEVEENKKFTYALKLEFEENMKS